MLIWSSAEEQGPVEGSFVLHSHTHYTADGKQTTLDFRHTLETFIDFLFMGDGVEVDDCRTH